MRIFVTGGSGFVGQRLIDKLVTEGHQVIALVRSEEAAQKLRKKSVSIVIGTFKRMPEWEQHLDKKDAVIHLAAPVKVWGKWSEFQEDIVDCTRSLLMAADRHKVKRFVYLSSESVLQDKKPLLDVDETEPYPTEPNSYYGKAKKLAEIAILGVKTPNIHTVILRPPFIWGKGANALDTMRAKVKAGQFAWIDDGKAIIDMVHVDNIIHAIILSLKNGKDKNIYFITDDAPKTVRDFFGLLFSAMGLEVPTRNLPLGLAGAIAGSFEGLFRLFRIPASPPLSRFELAFVSQPRRYKINNAKRDLGYKPVVDFQTGLKEMQPWGGESRPG